MFIRTSLIEPLDIVLPSTAIGNSVASQKVTFEVDTNVNEIVAKLARIIYFMFFSSKFY